jgi:hypothetical protein
MIWDSRFRAIQRKMQDEAKVNVNHSTSTTFRFLSGYSMILTLYGLHSLLLVQA